MGLGVLGIASSIVTGALDVYDVWSTGKAQSDLYEYNSKVAARNAEQERRNAAAARAAGEAAGNAQDAQTDAELAMLRRKNAFAMSENRALLGASGTENSGSNLLFAIDNAITLNMDEQNSLISGRYNAELKRYEGRLNAYHHEQSAANYDERHKFLDYQRKTLDFNNKFKLGATLLSSAINVGTASGNAMGKMI